MGGAEGHPLNGRERRLKPPDDADPRRMSNRRTAEKLVGMAFGEDDPAERRTLARRAITADDSNPDAWGVLTSDKGGEALGLKTLGVN